MTSNLRQSLAMLQKSPVILNGLLRGISANWVYTKDSETRRSPFDLVRQLTVYEETKLMSAGEPMACDPKIMTAVSFPMKKMVAANNGFTMEALLDEFTRLRNQNIQQIQGFGWSSGDSNNARVHLRKMLTAWVEHDLYCIGQITSRMANQYTTETGPLKAFIGIIK
jgi:hypothetical protein